MGGCNSTSAGHLARGVEQRCARRRAGSSGSSSSSTSSSSLQAGAKCKEASSKENAAIKQAGRTNWRPEQAPREQSNSSGTTATVVAREREAGCPSRRDERASLAQRKREEKEAARVEREEEGKGEQKELQQGQAELERRKVFEKLRGKFIASPCMWWILSISLRRSGATMGGVGEPLSDGRRELLQSMLT